MDYDYLSCDLETPPRFEHYIQPVNGIVQPPVIAPPGRPGRRTNVLESLKSVLKVIWKNNASYYFRHPVNAVSLGIPDYHQLIRYPMDLSTIKKRLHNNYYWNADEALEDFELIFENCMLYNPEGSQVYIAGSTLKDVFYTRLADIEMGNEYELLSKSGIKKRKAAAPTGQDHNHNYVGNYPLKHRKVITESLRTVEHFEVDRSSYLMPNQGIETLSSEEHPDFESKIPTRPESPKINVNPNVLIEWQDFLIEKTHCEHLLKCMTKRKRTQQVWPFKCSDLWRDYAQNGNYDHDSEQKLDWKILKSRLERNQFQNFDEFIQTIRIMFQNALMCFPIDKSLIASVNETNEIFEGRLEKYRDSISNMKKRIRQLADKKMTDYNTLLAEHEEM